MDTDVTKSDHESLPSTAPAERASMMDRDQSPETPKMAHDSMVTVRLSEPESLLLDTSTTGFDVDTAQSTPTKDHGHDSVVDDVKHGVTIDVTEDVTDDQKDNTKVGEDDDKDNSEEGVVDASSTGELANTATPRDSKATMPPPIVTRSLQDELLYDDHSSDDQEEVNWEQLEKTEDEQTKDDETDNVRTCSPPLYGVEGVNMLTGQVNRSLACTT